MKKQDISPSAITAGYLKRQRRYILTTGILLLLTLSLAAVMMLYGNTIYSPETVLAFFPEQMQGVQPLRYVH